AAAIDPALSANADQLEAALGQIEDAARALGRYARDVEMDPSRLAELEERLDRLSRLERKYGGELEAVIAHREAIAAELEELDDHDVRRETMTAARDAALEEASALARALRERRRGAAEQLGALISAELASLGMGDARVEVAMAPLEGRGDLCVDGARLGPT